MADLKLGSTVGGSPIWTGANLPLRPRDNSLYYKDFVVFTSAHPPTAGDVNAVKKSGDTMTGTLILPRIEATGNNGIAMELPLNHKIRFKTTGSGWDIYEHSSSGNLRFRTHANGEEQTNTNANTIDIGPNSVTSSAVPSHNDHLTNKAYTDTKVAKTGDIMTGNLAIRKTGQQNAHVLETVNSANQSVYRFDAENGLSFYHAPNGTSGASVAQLSKTGLNVSTGTLKELGHRVYSPNNKPLWADVGGNEFFYKTNGSYIQTKAGFWNMAADETHGWMPSAAGTAGSSKSFLGNSTWWFKEAWVNSYRGGDLNITGTGAFGGDISSTQGSSVMMITGTGNYGYLKGGVSTAADQRIKVTGFGRPELDMFDITMEAGKNPTVNGKQMFHEGHTPTPSEVGAVSKTGDTMTGSLTISAVQARVALVNTGGGARKAWAVESATDEIRIVESDVGYPIRMKAGAQTDIRQPRASTAQETVANSLTRKDYVDTGLSTKVNKTGDTMTGKLSINRSATIGGGTIANGAIVINDKLGIDENEIYTSANGLILGSTGIEGVMVKTGTTTRFEANATQVKSHVKHYFTDWIRSENRGRGLVGVYDSYKTQAIWTIGEGYPSDSTGANFGRLYGAAYKHTNNPTGGTMAGGHQFVWVQYGTPTASLGDGIWTKGHGTFGNIKLTQGAAPKIELGNGNTYIQYTVNGLFVANNNTAGKVVIEGKVNPVARVNGTDSLLYHEGHRPTPAEVGAVSKTGDTMTGNLVVPRVDVTNEYALTQSERGNIHGVFMGRGDDYRTVIGGGGSTGSVNIRPKGITQVENATVFDSTGHIRNSSVPTADDHLTNKKFTDATYLNADGDIVRGNLEFFGTDVIIDGISVRDNISSGAGTDQPYVIARVELSNVKGQSKFGIKYVNPSNVEVVINGIELSKHDYTLEGGESVTLNTPIQHDDDLIIIKSYTGAGLMADNYFGVPIGTFSNFLEGKLPEGWLIPDGSKFDKNDYPSLYTLLGTDTLPDIVNAEDDRVVTWLTASGKTNKLVKPVIQPGMILGMKAAGKLNDEGLMQVGVIKDTYYNPKNKPTPKDLGVPSNTIFKILADAYLAEVDAIGTIKPWMSDKDIPEGWHHLGLSQEDVEYATAHKTTGRPYKYSEFPEFCDFLNKQQDNPLGSDAKLWLLGNGEVIRQTVSKNPIEIDSNWRDCDVTKPWDWQGDAIRPVTGYAVLPPSLFNNAIDVGGAFSYESGTANIRNFNAVADSGGTLKFDISRVHPVAKDVRMVNRSVNYIIKVKHTAKYYALIDAINRL